jgi:hypothetical protein
MKIVDVLAVGRERTEEEKKRRHLYGDKGAKFSKGKRLCLMGGKRMRYNICNKRQFSV